MLNLKRFCSGPAALVFFLLTMGFIDPGPKKQATFVVTGFTCSGCADDLRAKVQKFDGVDAVEVSFEERYVKVRFDAAKTSAARIEQTIETQTPYRVELKKAAGARSRQDRR